MARGIHSKPNTGASVEWLTPPWLLESSPAPFDLDPCAHPLQIADNAPEHWPDYAATMWHNSIGPFEKRSHLDREHVWCDGLEQEWEGRVWLNPPYGKTQPEWMRRMADHQSGIALVASRTEVERWFWPYIWEAATAVFFIRGRLHYYHPDGTEARGNAGHGSVLAAYSLFDAAQLLLWAERCPRLRGIFIPLRLEAGRAVNSRTTDEPGDAPA